MSPAFSETLVHQSIETMLSTLSSEGKDEESTEDNDGGQSNSGSTNMLSDFVSDALAKATKAASEAASAVEEQTLSVMSTFDMKNLIPESANRSDNRTTQKPCTIRHDTFSTEVTLSDKACSSSLAVSSPKMSRQRYSLILLRGTRLGSPRYCRILRDGKSIGKTSFGSTRIPFLVDLHLLFCSRALAQPE